jgi:hypothetical protein
MDMRGYIAQRLDEMKSPNEKNLLREVMEEIFIPLYDHMEGQYARLESSVRDEMPFKAGSFVLWTCLMGRENAAGGCPYLYPVLEEDLHWPAIELQGLRERLRNEREIRLDTVFIQADYLVCKEIEDSREICGGVLRTENGEFSIGIRLRRSKRYSACIENLYRLFISNGIPWQTINAPYIFKMFDVMLVRLELSGKDEAGSVSSYEASFGKYDGYIKRGFLPVWNVRRKQIKGEDFPLAALDKVNYEYVFDLSEDGAENGYLADYGSADISAVRREENKLIVTSPVQKSLVWDMYKVMKRKDYITDYFAYELMDNAPEDSFAARMVAHHGIVVKTGAELRRILSAYTVSDTIELDSAQVVYGQVSGETYEVNDFLTDEIRDLAVSKSLLLKFKPLKRNSFILRDTMSFLVSQTQLIYPEFHCVGVLI